MRKRQFDSELAYNMYNICMHNYVYVRHAQKCNIFSPASCPWAHASGLYAWVSLGLGWYLDMVLAVRSSMARDGTSAGNDMDREPGTRGGKPGTRDGAGYGRPSTRDGKPGTRDGVSGTTGYVWQAWHRGQ